MKTKPSPRSAAVKLRALVALLLCSAAMFLAFAGFAQSQTKDQPKESDAPWPSISDQLAKEYYGHKVLPGSKLEALIRDNQQFEMLRDDEKSDKRNLPAWLRVWWRKAHPELDYPADDPTGGYPLVLKEILEWMITHQDLAPGPGVDAIAPAPKNGTADVDVDASTGPDFRISGPQVAPRSESDIRVNYFDTSKIISGSNNIASGGQQAMYFSTDGGANWGQTLLPFTASDTFHSDPTVDWTSDSRAWSSTLGIQGGSLRLRNYISTDNGATWTFETTPSGTQTSVDKQMVWIDKSPSSPYQNQIYAIWHNGAPAFMNRRTAGPAGAWNAAPTQVSGAESTGTAIGSDVKTNSAGHVFAAWPTTTNRRIFLIKSIDGGATYTAPLQIAATFDGFDIGVPSFANRRAFIYVTLGAYKTASKDLVYATWMDLSGETGCTAASNEPGTNVNSTCKTRIWFSRSTNGGTSWSAPVKINNQPGLNDQYNQWLVVDETNGGLAIIYYDTVGDPGRKKTDIWYQSSGNDGATWSAPLKITTAMTDETTGGQDSGNQYGDYNGLSGIANSFFPSWTDRRSGGKEEIWTAKITDTFAPSANVVGSSSSLVSGGCSSLPANGVNPGQTATVSFCLLNNGTLDAANVVGTLQATGGVSNPSAPQSFGTIPTNGTVCRTFKFTPNVACGSPVTAKLDVQDGSTTYGTVTKDFTTGVPNVTFVENFDGVTAPALPAGWTPTFSGSGTAPTTVTQFANSAPNAVFFSEAATQGLSEVTTPSFVVTSANAQLTFRNQFNTEVNWDGLVLEISINGGAFQDILAAGGTFVSGGYNSTLSTSASQPMPGRAAWTGLSGGTAAAPAYITTVVNLPAAANGQNVQFKWRQGSDGSVLPGTNPGSRIDNISIATGSLCAPLPVSAVSRKTHAAAGTFDIPLPLSGTPGVESRSGGANGDHQVVVTFASPVSASGASIAEGSGNVSQFAVAGSEVTMQLSGITNAQTTTINVAGVNDGTNSGCVNIPMAVLVGDTNANRTVSASDVGQTKAASSQPITNANFRADVTVNGAINASDVSAVKAQSGTTVP